MSNVNSDLGGNYSESNRSNSQAPADDIDGYIIPVTGLADGTFYNIHAPALTFICLSFICAVSVIFYSFYNQKFSTFFEWTKSERFVIYMAVCDGLFNMSHFCDHFRIVVTKTLPTPKALCAFYAIMLTEFISAQNPMVNIVAINIFVLIYFRKQLDFGRWDYKLLLVIFGIPGLGCIFAAAFGQFGPNGSFCAFDGIKGKLTNIFFTTIPLALVIVVNSILYVISFLRIYNETQSIKDSLGDSSRALRALHNAAKTMSLFVVAFFIQWWALTLFGVWQLVTMPPQLLFHFVTTFSNVGGILNGIVFLLILRRKRTKADSCKASDEKESGHKTTSTRMPSSVQSNEAAMSPKLAVYYDTVREMAIIPDISSTRVNYNAANHVSHNTSF